MKKSIVVKILILLLVITGTISIDNISLSQENTPDKTNTVSNLSDENLKTYVLEVQRLINENWKPPKGRRTKKVEVKFSIGRNGDLINTVITTSSNDETTDKAAMEAIKTIFPIKPLPATYQPDKLDIKFVFDYNVWNDSIPKAISLDQYLKALETKLFMKWNILSANKDLKGVAVFAINENGELINPQILYSSGSKEFDNLILYTISSSSPFYQLPEDYKSQKQIVRATFKYDKNPSVYVILQPKEEYVPIKPTETAPPDLKPKYLPPMQPNMVVKPIKLSPKQDIKLSEYINTDWQGEIVTPNIQRMALKVKYTDNDSYLMVDKAKFKIHNVELTNGNEIGFFIITNPQSNAKLSFKGRVFDNEIKGVALDNSGKEGYWFIKKN